MNHNITIHPMTEEDIQSVCDVWKKAGLAISDYEREQFELKMLMNANPKTCLVVQYGKDIIGTIVGASNGRRVWIYHLAVLPEWQHKGIGSKLLLRVEKNVKQQGLTKMLLGVGLENLKVIPFYEKQGFIPMMDMLVLQKNLYVKGGEHL